MGLHRTAVLSGRQTVREICLSIRLFTRRSTSLFTNQLFNGRITIKASKFGTFAFHAKMLVTQVAIELTVGLQLCSRKCKVCVALCLIVNSLRSPLGILRSVCVNHTYEDLPKVCHCIVDSTHNSYRHGICLMAVAHLELGGPARNSE